MNYRHATAGRLSIDQAHAAVARLACGLPGIRSCVFDLSSQEIVVEFDRPEDADEGKAVVESVVAAASGIRVAGRRVLRRAPRSTRPGRGRGSTTTVEREEAVDLTAALDHRLRKLGHAVGARDRAYGSLIRLSTMAKCDYLKSFPQNAYLVAEFPHNWRILERLEDERDATVLARLSEYMLCPAVCFHSYEELSARELAAPVVLTAAGTCFRHEAAWRVGGPRLREFSMREVVFVGDADFVDGMRDRLMDQIWCLFRQLGLFGHLETASDPFYLPGDSMKAQYQLMAGVKYELVAELPDGEELALGSFNNVGDTLCTPFDISLTSGAAAHSGCVALGLDRWVYTLLREVGSNAARRALGSGA